MQALQQHDTSDKPEHQALRHDPAPSPHTSTASHSSDILQCNHITEVLSSLSRRHHNLYFIGHFPDENGLASYHWLILPAKEPLRINSTSFIWARRPISDPNSTAGQF